MILIIASACNEEEGYKIQKPSNLIELPLMTQVIRDMHLSDAKVHQIQSNEDSLKTIRATYHEMVFHKYHVTRKAYDESYLYYLSYPNLMDSMYNQIEVELNEKLLRQNAVGVKPVENAAVHTVDSGERSSIQISKP